MFIIYLLILALSVIYWYMRRVYSYWSRNGMPNIEPSIPFGNLSRLGSGKVSFGVAIQELYQQVESKFIGIYLFFRPAILIRDPDLAKRILTTDFKHFHDRGVYYSEHDPISANLFAMPGQKWRNLRAKLTPSFSSGKIKSMLPIIMKDGDRLDLYMQNIADRSEVAEMKEITSRYTLNVIGSSIFGLEVDTINNPNDSFLKIERIIRENNFINKVRATALFLCPKILEYFHIPSTSTEVREYMINIVKQQIEFREKNNIIRKDFVQSLIELRKTGKVNDDDKIPLNIETAANDLKSMSIEQCAAQIFLFYVAGFDTTSLAITFTLFELSRRPELMEKLHKEIDETIEKHNGELTYECIQDMEFLELCFKETIRKYPGLPFLNRICTEDYQIPDTDTIIKNGTPIIISVLGMARDEQYFPEPNLYRPERFSDPVPQYNENAYLPFGDGPRACVAIRMGKLVAKIGLVKLLKKYNFTATNTDELEFDTFATQIKGGVNLKVTNRIK